MARSNEKPAIKPEWREMLESALTLPGAMGETYDRFTRYTTFNKSHLRRQGCPVEPIATLKRWNLFDRYVKKGSKAYSIWRPITVKREDKDGEEVALTRFKLVNCIFPYSDTEGADLPEYEPQEWSLTQALGVLGINRVAFESMESNTAGYSRGRDIAINPMAKYPLKTAVHEIAHVALNHTDPASIEQHGLHRGVAEFQAEGTAYLVMNDIGATEWDPAESRAYVQTWLNGETPDDAHIKAVFTATDQIIRAGEPKEESCQ